MHEAARYIGFSYKGFAANYREWNIPFHKIGRSVKFAIRDLDFWLEGKRVA
jgi:hypothetical protein